MSKRKVAVVIHFDSLVECAELLGTGEAARVHEIGDPCYTRVMDRILALLEEYGVTPSIFLVGRHLEQPYVAEAVKHWHARGCEIGNHTWSHHNNFGWIDTADLDDEVRRAHEIILTVIGTEPKGFVAPSWSFSRNLRPVLERLGYGYDISLAPTWLLDLSQLVLWLRSPGRRDRIPILRPDLSSRLSSRGTFSLEEPRTAESFVEAPLPTGWARTGFWHTLFFVLPDRVAKSIFESAYRKSAYFYYTLHPLDLIDPDTDFAGFTGRFDTLARSSVALGTKEALLRRSLDRMARESEFVTMEQLVADFRASRDRPQPLSR